MPVGNPGSGTTYTWIGPEGVAASTTVTADWSPAGSPQADDTAILTDGGTILLGDGDFQNNVASLGDGELSFTGDSLVNAGAPSLDATTLITTDVGSAVPQASTIDATGNFVNAGTILADGASGSSLTIDIGPALINGTVALGYAYNPGLIEADAGNTLAIDVGVDSELFSGGSIVADGGDVIIDGTSSAIVSGFAPVRGMLIIEGGGTIETNAAYASTDGGTRAQYYFADSTPGNTLKIDNAGSFNGSIGGFASGDTIDLGANLGTVTTLVYNLATNFLVLESIAAGVTTVLDTLLIGNTGSAGFSTGTFAVDGGGDADGFIIGTIVANGTTDTALTTNLTSLYSSNVSGVWQDAGSWQSGVPGTGSSPVIGLGATSAFTLTTGSSPVSVGGIAILSPLTTLQITSDTTATTGTISDYNGTLDVEAGNTLSGGALLLTEPSAASTIAAGATLNLSGRLNPNLAPISNIWGTQAGNAFAFSISAGTVEVDGAVLAGPSLAGGGGGSSSIGYDSNTSASVTVNTGGTVTDAHSLLGSDPSSSGTLTLNGAGASWTDAIDVTDSAHQTGYLLVGYDDLSANTPSPAQAAAAQLTIENGAAMTEGEAAYIGDSLDSSGNVTVTAGGLWDLASNSTIINNGSTVATNVNAGALYVGFAGGGSLSVLNGGTVEVGTLGTFYGTGTTFTAGGIEVGDSAGATGTVTVSGTGSRVSSLDGLTVGRVGQGLVSILNGGTVQINGGGVSIGTTNTAGSSGTIDVGGPTIASALNFAAAAGGLTVGSASQGTLNVSDNGTINLNGTGGLTIGSAAGSVGSVIVGGTTASAAIDIGTRGLTVGNTGTGVLTVNSLGTISLTGTNSIVVGQSSGASGTMIVNGGQVTEGATATGIGVGLSANAPGSLLIENSGTVALAGGGVSIASASSASGTVTVTGAGALLKNTGTGSVNVGGSGNGLLTVSSGGSLAMTGTGGINITSGIGGSSQMTVTGGFVTLGTTSGFVTVGGAGTGTLTVNGGTLTSESMSVGAGGIGLLTLEGGGTLTNAGTGGISLGGFGIGGGGSVTINNATLTDDGSFNIGNTNASGTLQVGAGGTLTSTSTAFAAGFIDASGTGTAAATVNGGTWNLNGQLDTGGNGSGSLDINSSGLVNAGTYGVNIGGGTVGAGRLSLESGGSLNAGFIGLDNGPSVGATATLSLAGGTVTASSLSENTGGTVTISSGSLAVSGFITVGQSGTGAALTLSGGGISSGDFSIAQNTSSAGTVTISGGTLSPNGLGIGSGGAGVLTILTGGKVSNTGTNSVNVGFGAGSSGNLIINGGVLTDVTGFFGVGQTNASGALLVENGGSLTTGGTTAITDISAFGTGQAEATISGGTWTSDNQFIVGDTGSGALAINGDGIVNDGTHMFSIGNQSGGAGTVTVSGGGTLDAGAQYNGANALQVGAASGATGTLTVTGAGSVINATGQIDVGGGGAGGLLIANQATVQSGSAGVSTGQGVIVAQNTSGSGAITVTGTRSLLTNAGEFIVGDFGQGNLTVDSGGVVTTTSDAIIANTASASGSSVNVTGAGSDLIVAGTLVVGASGFGSLSLSQGASVIADALDLSSGTTGDGDVSLAGVGTTLTITGALTLGDQAAGELSILGGARMTIGGGLVGGTSGAGGNLDIEGSGSQLTINGGTLVVGENGPAEFTLGIGATLSGEVSTDLFGVTNEYGIVDPATDPVDGTQNVGFGSSSAYDFYVANSGTIHITSGTATFYTPLVTFETNASNGSVNGLWQIGAKDTLVMNATSVDNSQTFDLTSAVGATLVIGQVPQGNASDPDTFNGQTMPTLTGSIAPGAANVLAGWDAPIANYASGDVITLAGLTYGSATASGDVVTVWSGPAGGGNALGSLTFIDTSDQPSSAQAALAATQINALACFVAGTRIGTVDGWRKVEDLAVGDAVRTVDGRCEPIVWVGSRAVDCGRHPKPETVWPVRISAGAFGENVPVRDLYLSPDHAVYVDGVLVPVKLLVNGSSIVQVKRNRVVYHHVELPEHAVILADGLAVESYLDTGDRAKFSGGAVTTLHPDFTARTWEMAAAAPLIVTGTKLAAAQRWVNARAAEAAQQVVVA